MPIRCQSLILIQYVFIRGSFMSVYINGSTMGMPYINGVQHNAFINGVQVWPDPLPPFFAYIIFDLNGSTIHNVDYYEQGVTPTYEIINGTAAIRFTFFWYPSHINYLTFEYDYPPPWGDGIQFIYMMSKTISGFYAYVGDLTPIFTSTYGTRYALFFYDNL